MNFENLLEPFTQEQKLSSFYSVRFCVVTFSILYFTPYNLLFRHNPVQMCIP